MKTKKTKKKQRKLTVKEQKRLEIIIEKRAALESEGYTCFEKILGALYFNVMALIVMLPYVALMYVLFLFNNAGAKISFSLFNSPLADLTAILAIFAVLIVLHELIHGIFFALSVSTHWKAVEFGFNPVACAFYCTCLEALSKKSYIISAIMPTVFLGFLPCILAIFSSNAFIFCIGLVMIFSGGGDFLIIYNVLKINSKKNDVLFIDHPTEIGSIIFIREKKINMFKKNKKYKVIEPFEINIYELCIFQKNEQLIYKGSGFIPYDELYTHCFINSQKEKKYLIVKNENELNGYLKYFEEVK